MVLGVRPIIGLTTYVEQARFGGWDVPAALVPFRYVRAVTRAGGRAVLLPPDDGAVQETAQLLDGLLLIGGSDLDPALYGAEPHQRTAGIRPERDRGELGLLGAALALDVPLLGICRGMQVLNVAFGGTLHQHLPDVVGHEGHRPPEPGRLSEHPVDLTVGSRIHRILGSEVTVASYHHQGIATVGVGLCAVGHAPDGTVEAVEAVDPDRFLFGVLWHPEQDPEDSRLFEALVEAAHAHRRQSLLRA